MRIIAAIDIIDGKCVRLTKGAFDTKKIYNENPLEMAKEFETKGIKYLHLVDLDGARTGKIFNRFILEKIAINTKLKIDFGGGIKSLKDAEIAFECGADQVTGGSIAIKNPVEFIKILEKFGPEKIILGADVNQRKIAVSAWLENTDNCVIDFITKYYNQGIRNVICTDISKDGMLNGPSVNLYQEILQNAEVNLIASGGVSSISDLEKLQTIGCEGAIVGKAIYEGKISLQKLTELC
ncbi:MAG: 1-(5-phosphoribosyl)-5-[(5-phosphoribosylamino)methylideneamino]imidazole-4-carboxamide isomerase [Bacteroidales bacterium]|nr:1-(5-phosphoribosyl)-5-[(5-phosphoribosylamino)methylideneamino]imidazole-4-carboxamide isomerase [Bacteroidales bacterium]